jgi:hypothetical protein
MSNTLRHGCAGLVALALLLSALNATALGGGVPAEGKGGRYVGEMTISEVLKERTGALMSIQGVVGTGQGLCDGRPCIKVYVVKKTPEVEQKIRSVLEPYPFSIQESGRFESR